MAFIMGILGAIGAVLFYMYRARDAANVAGDLMDMAGDVRAAARRFGFRRKQNMHAAESIDDPNIAGTATAYAFMALGDHMDRDALAAFQKSIGNHYVFTVKEAEEAAMLARWLVDECQGPQPAITRMARRTFKLGNSPASVPLLNVMGDIGAHAGGLNGPQRDALQDIKRAFHL